MKSEGIVETKATYYKLLLEVWSGTRSRACRVPGEGTEERRLMSLPLLLGVITFSWKLRVTEVAQPYVKVHIMYLGGWI